MRLKTFFTYNYVSKHENLLKTTILFFSELLFMTINEHIHTNFYGLSNAFFLLLPLLGNNISHIQLMSPSL